MMVTVRVWRPGRLAVDVAVSVAVALVTAAGRWDRVASWLPHSAIVPLAVGQGLLLLARRRAPMAVLAAATLVGVFMLAVGYPTGPANFATWCAAYAVAMYGRRAEGADLAGTLRGMALVLFAVVAFAVAAMAPDVRGHPGPWGSSASCTTSSATRSA
jgi:hypothetical protein